MSASPLPLAPCPPALATSLHLLTCIPPEVDELHCIEVESEVFFKMRRPNHFNNRSNNAVLPSSFGGRTYSKYSKRSNNKSALLNAATVAGAILIGYQIFRMVQPNDVSFWENNKPASFTLRQIYESRNCDTNNGVTKELYFLAWWGKFYKTWKKHDGRRDPYFIRSEAPSDFIPPTEPKETNDGTGRGVFATRDIKKGEMIYGKTTNLAYFASGRSFQTFLESLQTNEEACDFMRFSLPQSNFGPNGESAIVAVLDYHSFMHDGGGATNCGCIGGKNCAVDEFALRDIKKGEQIHCSFDGDGSSQGFLDLKGWKEFGL